jgi:hypothetical protein
MFREKIKKSLKWIKENKEDILFGAGFILTMAGGTYVTVEFVKACQALSYNPKTIESRNKFLNDLMCIKPLDVQKTDRDGGWLLLDCYQPNLYWPITHGLNKEELDNVSNLVETKNISTGQALMELGLLRSNC